MNNVWRKHWVRLELWFYDFCVLLGQSDVCVTTDTSNTDGEVTPVNDLCDLLGQSDACVMTNTSNTGGDVTPVNAAVLGTTVQNVSDTFSGKERMKKYTNQHCCYSVSAQ